jgi:RNA-directed DNA polymerase
MKRAGNLIEKIADTENLYQAFYKSAKAKRAKNEVLDYEKNLDSNLSNLQQQIISGNISTGDYHYFKIYDPKERTICAASFPKRVLHHAVMNICHPYFERQLIYHTYATRIGKGTYAALDKAKEYVKKHSFYAKLDVRKYFDSISHNILNSLLERIFKDKTLLLLFDKIISSYEVNKGYGIPIGNLTSQYFANYYLSKADHFAKEYLKIPGYIRYMDDILLFENDKNLLKEKLAKFKNFVETNLLLSFKPSTLNYTSMGVSFLGYRLFPAYIKLNSNSKRRFCKKMAKYQDLLAKDIWSQNEFARHVLPLVSFTEYATTKQLRKKVILYDF